MGRRKGFKTHGFCYTREWRAWAKMRKRNQYIPKYAARGIHPEWEDFMVFREYVLKHLGPHPGDGWSLDRIDNEVGYFPGNIRWMPIEYQRKQGGLAPHVPAQLSDESRKKRREVGKRVGRLRADTGKRLPNGQFARGDA